jgi:hypothetical protein
MANKFAVSDQQMKDFLLEICITQQEKLNAVKNENGMEDSVLTVNGKVPEFQLTIDRLMKQIEKQDKWLKERKEEVTTLMNALTECRKRKEFYKIKAAEAMASISEMQCYEDRFLRDKPPYFFTDDDIPF